MLEASLDASWLSPWRHGSGGLSTSISSSCPEPWEILFPVASRMSGDREERNCQPQPPACASTFKYKKPCGDASLQEMKVPLLSLCAQIPQWEWVQTDNQATGYMIAPSSRASLSFGSHWPCLCFSMQTPGSSVGKPSYGSSSAGPLLRESQDGLLGKHFPFLVFRLR